MLEDVLFQNVANHLLYILRSLNLLECDTLVLFYPVVISNFGSFHLSFIFDFFILIMAQILITEASLRVNLHDSSKVFSNEVKAIVANETGVSECILNSRFGSFIMDCHQDSILSSLEILKFSLNCNQCVYHVVKLLLDALLKQLLLIWCIVLPEE